MAIPTYDEIMLPLLQLAGEGSELPLYGVVLSYL
jgi:hypothetical protein